VAANVCNDPQVIAVIDALKSSMLAANGATFSTLVSPNGMQVRYFRAGEVITYSAYQAKFLFVTTYQRRGARLREAAWRRRGIP
jgi:hypothetical protein